MLRVAITLALLSMMHLDFTRATSVTDEQTATAYLRFYEHMPETGGNFKDGLKSFQKMANTEQTGELDDDTLSMMNTPRCGNTDKLVPTNIRSRRFAARARYPRSEISWRVNTFGSLGLPVTERIMERALEVWAEVADLSFRKETNPNVEVDFNIEWYFGRGIHPTHTGGTFDGPLGVLAHAFFPSQPYPNDVDGDAHFDGDEDFTDGTPRGINLFQVAVHEFGHSLGLGHSDVEDALMYAFYRGYQADFSLHQDDIDGIVYLYGERSGDADGPMRPIPRGSCPPNNIDAVTNIQDTTRGSFLFQGDQVWEFSNDEVLPGYPKQISTVFNGLPSNLDAAVYDSFDGRTYFFQGSSYFEYSNFNRVRNGLISERWIGVPNNIDAAFEWSRNGRVYLMKDNAYYYLSYYSYDSANNYYRFGYNSRPLSDWNLGVARVDAAFQWTQRSVRTYFFSGDNVIRYDDVSYQPETGFPMSIDSIFGCDQQSVILDGTEQPNTTDSAIIGVMPSFVIVTISALSVALLSRDIY